MTSNNDSNDDRFISKKELTRLVVYSSSHIARLEKRGEFPSRIQLGPCRVVWSYRDVAQWMADKKTNSTKNNRHSAWAFLEHAAFYRKTVPLERATSRRWGRD
jgi:predicted DNA-binding transcriptional regulator AlpA